VKDVADECGRGPLGLFPAEGMKRMKSRSAALSRGLLQAGILLLVACVAGGAMNMVRSSPLPWVADWSPGTRFTAPSGESLLIPLQDAIALFKEGRILFLDARPAAQYEEGHIPGAWSVPWQSFDQYVERLMAELPEDRTVVTYCDGEHCALSGDLARALRELGYENIRVLHNGWTRWREAGLPVERGDGRGS